MPEPTTELQKEQRKERILALALAGYSSRKIAKAMEAAGDPISHVTAAKYVREAIQEAGEGALNSASVLRQKAHLRHEQMINRLWLKAMPNDASAELDMDAMRQIKEIIAQDARICGYDAPRRSEVDMQVFSMSMSVVLEKIMTVIPDDCVPLVNEALEQGMNEVAQLKQGGRDD